MSRTELLLNTKLQSFSCLFEAFAQIRHSRADEVLSSFRIRFLLIFIEYPLFGEQSRAIPAIRCLIKILQICSRISP